MNLAQRMRVEEIPADYIEKADEAYHYMIECLAEYDEEIMELFLEDAIPELADIKKALRKCTVAGDVVPVACASAFKNKGVQPLLDIVIELMPSPIDVWSIDGIDPKTETPLERHVGDNQPFSALIFKLMNDPYVGKLTYFRVYSGTVAKGMTVYNPRTRQRERLGRILQMHANTREDRDEIYSGDIAAAVGLKNVTTGDTICVEGDQIILESMNFPEPVISIAVEPKTNSDRDKLYKALGFLSDEDPTFQVRSDEETSQTVISGMGELHLDIIIDRLKREFKVEANTGQPQVAYREAILKPAEANTKFVRQSGGRGQYGHVVIELEPMERGHGQTFENKIVGGNIPREYIKPVEKGIMDAAKSGVISGSQVVDFNVRLIDGSFHAVDSSEIAFQIAGSMAFKEAARKGGVAILEPVMKMDITTPDDHMGDIIGDVTSRRGNIIQVDAEQAGNYTKITAHTPLAELFGYATAMRSLSRGRASYAMEPSHFDKVPTSVQEKIMEKEK